MHSFAPVFFLLCWNYPTNCIIDKKRQIPFNENVDFYLSTSVGPYWDIEQDIPIQEFIRGSQILLIRQRTREQIYQEETANLNQDDGEHLKFDYRRIVKDPEKGPKSETIADWFLYYKGKPFSLIACSVIILPILIAGLLQTCIETCRGHSSKISRRSWEFPLVPILLLQQTRREYLLRKKTVRRFCIQWEVGRINIRMNTKLVDLRQILHPPRKQKKVHKYTTWRIIRLITRFNAFLATRKAAMQRTADQQRAIQKNRAKVWTHKINNSKYLVEKNAYDTELEMEAKNMMGGTPITDRLKQRERKKKTKTPRERKSQSRNSSSSPGSSRGTSKRRRNRKKHHRTIGTKH